LAEGPSREEVRDAFHDVNQYLAIDAAKGEDIPAPAWMARLLFAAIGGYVPTEDVDARDLMKPMEKEINQQALQQVLKEAWLGGELYLFCTGNVDLGAAADKQLRSAWDGGAGVAKGEGAATEAQSPESTDESSTAGSGAFAYGAK